MPHAYRHSSPREASTRALCASACRFPISTLPYRHLHRQSNVTYRHSLMGLCGLFEVAPSISQDQRSSRQRQFYFVQFITMVVFLVSAKICCRRVTFASDGMCLHCRASCTTCCGSDPRCLPGTLSHEGARKRLVCAQPCSGHGPRD